MKKLLTVIFVAIMILSFSTTTFAADVPASGSVEKGGSAPAHPAGPIQKAERGFMNAAFGWTEIPKRIVDKTKETKNPITGLLLGVFQGSCKAFARTVSGVADLATFPIGSYDKPQILPDMPAAE